MMSEKVFMLGTIHNVSSHSNTFCSGRRATIRHMEAHERLQSARKAAGYESAEDFANQIGVNPVTYRAHELGSRGFKSNAKLYARKLKTTAGWLLYGEASAGENKMIPIVGYVGAGATVLPFDDYTKGDGMDEVEAPPTERRDVVAIMVKGDSMWPAYRDGDVIFYTREGVNAESCVGRECIVKLVDGRTLIKQVMRGSEQEHFTLNSYNAPPLENERLEWASPVMWVKKAVML